MLGKEKKQKMTAAFVSSPLKTTTFGVLAVIFCFFSLAGASACAQIESAVSAGTPSRAASTRHARNYVDDNPSAFLVENDGKQR
jgi:uncharacterized membrane protein